MGSENKYGYELNAILTDAVERGASDIHLAVGAKPRCRIYGKLQNMDYPLLKDEYADALLTPLLDALARTQLHTTGNYDMAYQIHGVARFRVNIFMQKGALAGVFRVLNEKVPSYDTLGLPISVFNMYREMRGLILVVGVTGSGKSTTLASFLDIINKNEYKHIITLEDPIEYTHWHSRCLVNQREIGRDVESYQSGLRAALREDPDVILVGEMRDLETIDIAITAAETGHLVCSTLHTMSASATINRIIDMYPERQQKQVRETLASLLTAVIAQQLLPRKDGKGYILAYEIMKVDKQIRKYIRSNDVDAIDSYLTTKEAHEEGMCSMDETLFRLCKQEKISDDNAVLYSFDKKAMRARIARMRGQAGGTPAKPGAPAQ